MVRTWTTSGLTAAAALAAILWTAPARAEPELLMLDEKFCRWCEAWTAEVGVIYDKTEEGRRAPLRRISIHDPVPGDVSLAMRPQYTPTFVLLDDGVEVGRIEGYPGEEFFWGLLSQLLKKLPADTADPEASDPATADTQTADGDSKV